MPNKCRIGYRASESLLVGLMLAMKKEACSPRKKSQWICSAIQQMLSLGAKQIIEENVFVGDRLNENTVGQVLYLDDELSNAMNSMIFDLRRVDPLLEDIQSVLIRAAIRRRLNETKNS